MLIKSDGKAVRRPVLSPDGITLAVIAPDDRIHLINLAEADQGRRAINGIKVRKNVRPFVRTCTILNWSPEVVYPPGDDTRDILSNSSSECDFGRSWLLLSDRKRLIAVSTDIRSSKMMPTADEETGTKSNILADYDLGIQMGKITLAEFVFNHRYALVLFEFGSSAAILGLTRPCRDEIPHVKFPDARSLARTPDSRYLALLRRDRAQDRITVFELGENNELIYKSFDCHTSDAQDLTWCPGGQPVLAVWDSSSYGVKVIFMTAQGHAMRNFDIDASAFRWTLDPNLSHGMEGVELTYWSWRQAFQHRNTLTLQVLANGSRQVHIRYQSTESLASRTHANIMHPDAVNGTKTFIWLESCGPPGDKSAQFARQTETFEIARLSTVPESKLAGQENSRSHADPDSRVDIVELNANHRLIATRLSTASRVLFLWRPENTAYPHTMLIFKHAIRQISFHPTLPHVLVILTNSKNPRIYAWYQPAFPPIAGSIPIDTSTSTNYSGKWLSECASHEASSDAPERCPFLFTSNTAFEAGYLSSRDGEIMFESILTPPTEQLGDTTWAHEGDDSATEMIDTPSRPGKSTSGDDRNGIVKKARFDVPEIDETDAQIHEQASYRYMW